MFKKVLYPTDFSECNTKVTNFAIEFALMNNAKLYFCHVSKTSRDGDPLDSNEFKQEIEIKLKDMEKKYELLKLDVSKLEWDFIILFGDSPAEEIINFVEEKDFDIIVLPTHGKSGLKRFLIGSTTEKIVRHSPIPVLTVNSKKFAETK